MTKQDLEELEQTKKIDLKIENALNRVTGQNGKKTIAEEMG